MNHALPTKKQQALLEFIDEFIQEHSFAPSYREVMGALDYKSVSTVASHIDGLIARGWLVKRENSKRSLEVIYSSKNGPGRRAEHSITSPLSTHADWIWNAFEDILRLSDTTGDPGYVLKAEKLRDVMVDIGVGELTPRADEAIKKRRDVSTNGADHLQILR